MANRSGTKQRSSPRRVLRRITQGVAGLLAVLIVAAIAFSQTAAFRGWLREQVVTRANAALNGRVTIGNLEGSVLGSLVVTDLQVMMDGAELFAVKRLAATYNLLPLLTTRLLVLPKVSVEGIRLHLIQNEHGWNVARLVPASAAVEGKEAQAGPSLAVTLADLTISDGSLDVIRPDASYVLRQLSLRGSGTIDARGQRVQLETLSFAMPEREVHVEQIAGLLELDADGKLSAERIVLRTAASTVRARAQIGAEQQAYDVRVDVERLSAEELHRILGGTMPATDLWGSVHAQGPASAVSLDGTALESDAGALRIGGAVDLASRPYAYDLRLALEQLDAARLLGPAQPTTKLSGTITAKGRGITFDEAAGAFSVALSNSIIRETRFERLSAEGSIENRRIAAQALAKTNGGDATLAGTLNVGSQQYDLRLKAEQFDPTPFLNRKDLAARINGTVSVRGSGFEPTTAPADAHLTISPSQFDSIQIRKLDGVLHLADSQLTIERFDLDSSVATARASGAIGVQAAAGQKRAAASSGSLQYAVDVTDLRALARLAGSGPMDGSFTLNGTARGRLDALDVEAAFDGKRLAATGARIAALRAQVKAQAIGTPRAAADLTAQAEEIQASGRRLAAAHVEAGWKQDSAARSAATVALRIRQDEKHTHTLRARAEVAADESRVLLDALTLELGDETWKTAGVAQIVWRGARLSISDFALRSERGVLTLAGEGGARGAEDLTLAVQDLDLAPFISSQQGNVQGRLSVQAHLGGTAADAQLDAAIVIDQPAIEQVRYESARLDLHLLQGSATVSTRLVQPGASQLVFDARLPVRASLSPFHVETGDSLSGTLQATGIDLAFLDPLITPVSELRGTLTADLSLSGPLHKPEIRGPLSITEARAYVVPLGLTYDTIELRLRVDGSSVQIDALRIVSGEGSLRGGGQAQLSEPGIAAAATSSSTSFPCSRTSTAKAGRADGSGLAAARRCRSSKAAWRLTGSCCGSRRSFPARCGRPIPRLPSSDRRRASRWRLPQNMNPKKRRRRRAPGSLNELACTSRSTSRTTPGCDAPIRTSSYAAG